jgi:2-hydroxy-3-oxopropionate reductase
MSAVEHGSQGRPGSVGVIGLGVMGGGIAESLQRAGHALTVYVRSDHAAQKWLQAGARLAASPRELGATCTRIVLSLPDDAALDSVMGGADGLASGLPPGSCVVDTSTIGAATARRWSGELARRSASYLDAPVSGGQQGARSGALTAMVGGDRAAYDAVRPLAGAFCAKFIHVGPSGAGQIVKACNQVAVAGAFLGVAEALALAGANGIDLSIAREVLMGGSARSFALEKHGQRVIDRTFDPGFRAELMRKDLRIAAEAAGEGGVSLRAALAALQLVEELCSSGHGGLDWSAVALLVAGAQLPRAGADDGGPGSVSRAAL